MMERTMMMMIMMMMTMMTVVLVVIPAAAETEMVDEVFTITNDDIVFQEIIHTFLTDIREWIINHFRNWPDAPRRNLATEITKYTFLLIYDTAHEFTSDAKTMTLESLTDDLNLDCYNHLGQPLVNLREPLTNNTCVETRLREVFSTKLKRAMEESLRMTSRDCSSYWPTLCSTVNSGCMRTYEARVRQLTNDYLDDLNDLAEDVHYGTGPISRDELEDFNESVEAMPNNTYINFIRKLLLDYKDVTTDIYYYSELPLSLVSMLFDNRIEPYTIVNFMNPWKETFLVDQFINTTSYENLTWGMIKYSTGSVINSCSLYRDRKNYSRNILSECYRTNYMLSNSQLFLCSYSDPSVTPLTWSNGPSLFFNSQCLCVVSNGDHCSVKVPLGEDPLLYCYTMLMRDFQRQLRHRPAITYLDYAFQTRVPVCKLAQFLSIRLSKECRTIIFSAPHAKAMKCFLNGLVNKDLNCSETLKIDKYNYFDLCHVRLFMNLVSCDDEDYDNDAGVTYYSVGDSPLVLVLTYLDVAARFLTLVTYLVCPKLRNLPGKLLLGYLTTSLLRYVVVRATLDHLSLAVHVDVCMDLASTLWLTAYLYFLTTSLKALQPPDSLTTAQTRVVLFRSALLGWVLPAALSTAFFLMDDALQSHIQVGQLMFVFFYNVVLLANICMFFLNVSIYYNIKRKNSQVLTRREVVTDVFWFSLKTLILTGTEISIRLIVTQIQDMQLVLSHFHVVGILQGLLLFLFYGCCSEARAFWISFFRNLLRHIFQETSQRQDSLELLDERVSETSSSVLT